MKAVIWCDESLEPEAFRQWDAIGRPETFGRVFVAGCEAGPDAARWTAVAGVDSLLVLARVEGARAARRFVNVVSGARPLMPCALRLVSSNPVASLVRAADALRMRIDPVASVAVFEAALATTVSGMWLKSVRRLQRPQPTLGQYLRSLVPLGSGHVVVEAPEPAARPTLPIAVPPQTTALIVAVDGDETPLPKALSAAFPDVRVCRVAPITDTRRVHGSVGVEFMLDGVPGFMLGHPRGRCPGCGSVLHAEACPFCHLVATVQRSEAA